jgi:hypothetical protein
MPKTAKRSKLRTKRDGEFQYKELHRVEFLEDYEQITYQVSDGPEDDLASTVEWRIAVFEKPVPDEIKADTRWGWEGLTDALYDNVLTIKKEADYDAEQHKHEQDALMPAEGKDSYYSRAATIRGVGYGDFLEAIERVGENDDDEDAWKIIETWRMRQLRQEERV